jgi:hypothetical protein
MSWYQIKFIQEVADSLFNTTFILTNPRHEKGHIYIAHFLCLFIEPVLTDFQV